MAYHFCMNVLLPFYLLSCVPFLSHAEINLPLKAVNLGNWLVTEGWMKPSRFQHIPNKDLLDGTHVQLMSTKLQRFLSLENERGTNVVANQPSASRWETFRLWRINETFFNLRVFNKQFLGLENQGQGKKIVAVSNSPGDSETFELIRNDNPNKVLFKIKANNGLYLQAQAETLVTADFGGKGWEEDNPSVFQLKIVRTIQGEYQITNGYGPDRAPQIMQEHWNTYITEEDFRFMSANGLNAARIPVGWWIAHDPKPPKPFVGGSLKALDDAFKWAEKYGMWIIVDLHAAPGSQNGNDHSATRDGFLEWGDSHIKDTVAVIDFLASRYAKSPSFAAIELMNEPHAPDVNLETLKSYYKAGYDAVRKHTSSAYVIFANRLGPADPKELLAFAKGLSRVVIDVHYYNLFWKNFNYMNAQQNIDYIYKKRSSDLSTVTTSNSPLSFVGEWVCAWTVTGASTGEYQRFCKAQLDVYGRATFGWAYWAYKCDSDHWSIKWMIENNHMKLT